MLELATNRRKLIPNKYTKILEDKYNLLQDTIVPVK